MRSQSVSISLLGFGPDGKQIPLPWILVTVLELILLRKDGDLTVIRVNRAFTFAAAVERAAVEAKEVL